ncbi:MAG: glutathione transferase [Myxococcales bacterium]|nr:MAG: glutathione transferase [Myxococcales bacterium]
MITLFRDAYWISPYVFSVWTALRAKGLPFEVSEVKIQDGAQREPAYAAASVTARVPALTHDGFTVAESSAIVEYLEDAFPETARVLPVEPRARARARQVMSWLRSDDTIPLRMQRSTATMFYPAERAKNRPLDGAAPGARDKAVAVTERLLDEGGEWPFGGSFTVADADLAFFLHRLILSGDELPGRVQDYAARVWQQPTVQAFVTRERPAYVPY